MDLDLSDILHDQILVVREGYAFFVSIQYEKLPPFCSSCISVGQSLVECKKKGNQETVQQGPSDENKGAKPSGNYVYVLKLPDKVPWNEDLHHLMDYVPERQEKEVDHVLQQLSPAEMEKNAAEDKEYADE